MEADRAPYRDASAGLQARARELEQELARLGVSRRRFPASDSGDDVARIALLEHLLDDAERAFARRGQRWRWMAVVAAVLAVVGALLWAARDELERANVYAELRRESASAQASQLSRVHGVMPFTSPVRRTGRVTRVLGRSGVQPGDRCTVDVTPKISTGVTNCRVMVRCGTFRPFGDLSGELGHQWCETRDGRPVSVFDGRAGPAARPWSAPDEAADGDPMLALDLEQGTMIVGHDLDEYVVFVALTPETTSARGH